MEGENDCGRAFMVEGLYEGKGTPRRSLELEGGNCEDDIGVTTVEAALAVSEDEEPRDRASLPFGAGPLAVTVEVDVEEDFVVGSSGRVDTRGDTGPSGYA
jgi:hypothetical protein